MYKVGVDTGDHALSPGISTVDHRQVEHKKKSILKNHNPSLTQSLTIITQSLTRSLTGS